MTTEDKKFIRRAIDLAKKGMQQGAGGPFGAVVVKDGEIIAEGFNKVTSTNDPTAHAEMVAIREACQKSGQFQLTGCTLYTSCEPCPMCLGAIYWARPDKVIFGADRFDAADADFDDQFIYDEIGGDPEERKIPFDQLLQEEAVAVFDSWKRKNDKINY